MSEGKGHTETLNCSHFMETETPLTNNVYLLKNNQVAIALRNVNSSFMALKAGPSYLILSKN